MSRKTMDEIHVRPRDREWDLPNIYPPPCTMFPQNDDERAKNLLNHELNDETVTAAYNVPWRDASKLAPIAEHLESAEENFRDSVWSISEGKKDIRNLRSKPEWPRR